MISTLEPLPAYARGFADPKPLEHWITGGGKVEAVMGDSVRFFQPLDSDGLPTFNFDRSEAPAPIELLKKLVTKTKTLLIIRHDPRDLAKLPAFPKAA